MLGWGIDRGGSLKIRNSKVGANSEGAKSRIYGTGFLRPKKLTYVNVFKV